MAPSREQLISTARAFIQSYKTWDVEKILEHRAPNCVAHTLPATRKQPSRNNEEYGAFFSTRLPYFQNFTPIEHEDETFVDVEKRRVYMHIASTADTKIGAYGNEYAFVLRMTEAGDKVEEVWEYADSAYSESFFARLLGADKIETN